MILERLLSKSYAEMKEMLKELEKKEKPTGSLDHAKQLQQKEKPKQLALF